MTYKWHRVIRGQKIFFLNKKTQNFRYNYNFAKKETFENTLQAYMASVYIEATEKIYHGVKLIVGDYHDKTRREYGPTRMNYKERKIHFDPIVNT